MRLLEYFYKNFRLHLEKLVAIQSKQTNNESVCEWCDGRRVWCVAYRFLLVGYLDLDLVIVFSFSTFGSFGSPEP